MVEPKISGGTAGVLSKSISGMIGGPSNQLTVNSLTSAKSKTVDGKRSSEKSTSNSNVPGTAGKRGGGSHNSISPGFDMNPVTGTFAMSLPIHTTPSRSGVGPNLSLNYNSGSGNGAFGVGWELSTFSISRNVSKGVPLYNESDTFVLSGSDDLVLDSAKSEKTDDGYLIQRYRPRVESDVIRIERWEKSENTFWRTFSGDNVTTYYGESDNSRIFDLSPAGTKRVFGWLACRSYDSFGNAMELIYKSENSHGIKDLSHERWVSESLRSETQICRGRYLKSIKYGNRTPNRKLTSWEIKPKVEDAEWMFEVIFDYGEHDETCPTNKEEHEWSLRRFPFSTCNSGFEVRNYRLCRRILMFHRIPEKLKQDYCLVSSTSFKYSASLGMEMLDEVVTQGHLSNNDGIYKTQSLPPVRLYYTRARKPEELMVQSTTGELLHHYNRQSANVQWVDLFGDGAPGILHSPSQGEWQYQRNEMQNHGTNPSFGAPKTLSIHPSTNFGQEVYLEDLNRNGNMDAVYTDQQGRPVGYHEYRDSGCWSDWSEFETVPTFSLSEAETKKVDLTGDGLNDVLRLSPTGDIHWHKNLAHRGFAAGSKLEESGSHLPLYSFDKTSITMFADMTGDGLADLVVINNGKVEYWPNYGHGKFGSGIVMGNSPLFDHDYSFSDSRVYLTDVNGSGTTDLLYLPPNGGVHIYYNLAGNSWGSRVEVSCFPVLDTLSSVFAMDLLGTGTSCLCWLGVDPSKSESTSLYYIDLVGSQKPHLLHQYTTNLGSTTTITYQPSTHFSQADEQAGKPWKTRLPFPVYCVSEVLVTDEISQTSNKTRYAYHDGFYDGFEREFRGFGIVESWDEEDFSTESPKTFQRPPTRKKSWFYVGIADFKVEGFSIPKLAKNKFPSLLGKSQENMAEMHRSLKGSLARVEVYSDDGSALADVPYTVTSHSYEIREIQAKSSQSWAVFRVIPYNTLNEHFERNLNNPRVQREIILEASDSGNPLKTLQINYGAQNSCLKNPRDKALQEMSWATYTENKFTRIVTEPDYFCQPQLASTVVYQISNFDTANLEDIDRLQANDWEAFCKIEEITAQTIPHISKEPQKALVAASRTYFYDRSLIKKLPLGEFESMSEIYQTYNLAFTSEFLQTSFPAENIAELMKLGGYVQLDNLWWAPSGRELFSLDENESLRRARESFYTASIVMDPSGESTRLGFDNYHYLVTSMKDPCGNEVSFEHDYVSMQPNLVIDPNGNRCSTTYDGFGAPAGVAIMGKLGENIGDSLDSFDPIVQDELLEEFSRNPSGEICQKLLGQARTRTIYHPNCFRKGKMSGKISPSFIAVISSDAYGRDRNVTANFTIQITYLDGRGSPVQIVSLEEDASSETKEAWRFSEWMIKDSKGNVVQECHSKIAFTHQFQFASNADSVKVTHLLNPLDCVVGKLFADHTWEKVKQTPWSTSTFNSNLTINISDPSCDEDVGPFFKCLQSATYLPTWLQSRTQSSLSDSFAAKVVGKSLKCITKPPTIHTDGRGLSIIEETSPDFKRTIFTRMGYDMAGNLSAQWDQLGRLISTSSFNMLGQEVAIKTMDTGQFLTFSDCEGRTMMTWDAQRVLLKYDYDTLGREVRLWKISPGIKAEKVLLHEIVYGESALACRDRNLCGQVYCIKDQSGIRVYERFDITGNCVEEYFRMAEDYKSIRDWSKEVHVEERKYRMKQKFDAFGRSIQYQNTKGEIIFKSHHLNGCIRSVVLKPPGGGGKKTIIAGITYTFDEKPLEVRLGNGTKVSFVYDDQTRLLIRKTLRRASAPPLQDLHYVHDCLGRIVMKLDKARETAYFRNSRVSATWDYTYNPLGQLVQTSGRTQVNSTEDGLVAYSNQKSSVKSQQVCQYLESYTYDDAGNILAMQQEPLNVIGVSGWTRTFEYNHPSKLEDDVLGNSLSGTRVGSLTQFFDANETGCATSMPGYSSLSWDHNYKLQSSSKQIVSGEIIPETTYYVYNSEGTRVRKVTERSSTKDSPQITSKLKDTLCISGMSIYRKYSGDGTTLNLEKMTSEIYGLTSVIALLELDTLRKSVLVRFIPGDNLELDDDGELISYEEFSAFGSTTYLACQGDLEISKKYRFASYERDSETGLYYCEARYYAAWLGRWMSPDPMLFDDGSHLYAYVGNDPVNWEDHSGLCRKKTSTQKGKEAPKAEKVKKGIYRKAKQVLKDAASHGISLTKLTKNSLRNCTRTISSNLLKSKGFTEPTGHLHHLYMNKYKEEFRAAGIDGSKLKMYVAGTINQGTFNITHDKRWDTFMELIDLKCGNAPIIPNAELSENETLARRNKRVSWIEGEGKKHGITTQMHYQVLIHLSENGLLLGDIKNKIKKGKEVDFPFLTTEDGTRIAKRNKTNPKVVTEKEMMATVEKDVKWLDDRTKFPG